MRDHLITFGAQWGYQTAKQQNMFTKFYSWKEKSTGEWKRRSTLRILWTQSTLYLSLFWGKISQNSTEIDMQNCDNGFHKIRSEQHKR